MLHHVIKVCVTGKATSAVAVGETVVAGPINTLTAAASMGLADRGTQVGAPTRRAAVTLTDASPGCNLRLESGVKLSHAPE